MKQNLKQLTMTLLSEKYIIEVRVPRFSMPVQQVFVLGYAEDGYAN